MTATIYRVYFTARNVNRLWDYQTPQAAQEAARTLARRSSVTHVQVVALTTTDGWQTGERNVVPF